MTERKAADPSPFFLDGGPVGVLLIHGYTGSPPEMRLVGDYLNERGLTVSAPLLPGHGTTAEDLNRCHWSDWTDSALSALLDLRLKCQTVFVGGLSMGSLVAIYLAAHESMPAGTILYACPVLLRDRLIYAAPVLKYLVPTFGKSGKSHLVDPAAELRLWHYPEYPVFGAHELLKLVRRARRLLPRVTCPLLVIQTALDHHVHPRSGGYIMDRVASADKELLTLHNSSHVLTVDAEWENVAQKTYQFIQARSA
jgi:carboxylesterase